MGYHHLSGQPAPIIAASNLVAQTHPTRITPLTHPFSFLLLCCVPAMGRALLLRGCSSVTGGVDVALPAVGCPRVPVCSWSCGLHAHPCTLITNVPLAGGPPGRTARVPPALHCMA